MLQSNLGCNHDLCWVCSWDYIFHTLPQNWRIYSGAFPFHIRISINHNLRGTSTIYIDRSTNEERLLNILIRCYQEAVCSWTLRCTFFHYIHIPELGRKIVDCEANFLPFYLDRQILVLHIARDIDFAFLPIYLCNLCKKLSHIAYTVEAHAIFWNKYYI